MAYSRGTEIKINSIKNYNVTIGTIDKNNPNSLYIKITAWGNPIIDDSKNYRIIIRKLNKRLKTHFHLNLDSSLFKVDKTMVDLDMRESGVKYGKSSFLNCEITLFQLNSHSLNSDIIINSLTNVVNKIVYEILDKDEYFKFYKKKSIANTKLKLNPKD